MAFLITAPPALQLPQPQEGELQYFDPAMPRGFRCLWGVAWLVAKSPIRSELIRPRDWRFNDGPPDLEKLPDNYLLAELADVVFRGVAPFAVDAAQHYILYQEWTDGNAVTDWRFSAISFLEKIRSQPPQRHWPDRHP